LQRVLIEKEASLLETQGEVAKLQNEIKRKDQQNEILEAKLKAI
jgi:cell division protein FtsL